MSDGRLEGKVAIVTGATSGIGAAIAFRYAKEGAKVVLCARREDKGNANVEKIRKEGGEAIFVKTDVTVRDDVKNAVKKTADTYGTVDILVNNAGILLNKKFKDSTPDDWRRVMKTDALGSLYFLWEVLPLMKARKYGVVVQVGSKASTRPSDQEAFYCFVKAGMDHMIRVLTDDYAPFGIRLNVLAPGLTLTEMTESAPRLDELAKGVPFGRVGKAEEMADAALWLGSDESSYVSGAVINVDGGLVR
ncbi:MAG: SDR family oxidoreductase [Synergistaceae bacterium]|jgi:3-oxoacyl-[acyl-carrier protein] reductase|nr:SDR family oxidoreductase [Synergistaceae bacterium]